ncbi:MAG: hypothetical protein LBL41_03950 [Bifidobacteriaceae bacterium]|nr:hypothetical protein [Bifidobacteriaceae bacterium]
MDKNTIRKYADSTTLSRKGYFAKLIEIADIFSGHSADGKFSFGLNRPTVDIELRLCYNYKVRRF